MKITVIKKAIVNAKPQSWCGALIDDYIVIKR
jgi:hypothetical protein